MAAAVAGIVAAGVAAARWRRRRADQARDVPAFAASADRCVIRCTTVRGRGRFEAVLLEGGGGRRVIGTSPTFAAAKGSDLDAPAAAAAFQTLLAELHREHWRRVPDHVRWYGAGAPGARRHWFDERLERGPQPSREGPLARLGRRRGTDEGLAVTLARRDHDRPAEEHRRRASA
jgi:hypothetical protein